MVLDLSDYLKESIIKENKNFNASGLTKIQELLSCVFFDAYFNKGINFFEKNASKEWEPVNEPWENIVNYYNNPDVQVNIISQIARISGIKKNDFDAFMKLPENKNRYTKKDLEWINSYLYQCKSFENFRKNNKLFDVKSTTFVHHDSGIGINSNKRNGIVSDHWEIDDRVKTGQKQYKIKSKDTYQCADVYAVINDTNNKVEPNIDDEITYWTNAIYKPVGKKFIGISLKKLSASVNNPTIYDKNTAVIASNNDVICKIPLFNNIVFDTNDFSKCRPGVTYSSIVCDVAINGNEARYKYDIRTSSKEASHYASANIMYRKDAKTGKETIKKSKECFDIQVSGEIIMLIPKANSQVGRFSPLVTSWCNEYSDLKNSPSANTEADSKKFDKLLTNITEICGKENIKLECNGLNPDAKKMIDFVANNADIIKGLFEKYDATGRIFNESEEVKVITETAKTIGINLDKNNYNYCFELLFSIVKWKNAAHSCLCQIDAILRKMEDKKSSKNDVLEKILKFGKKIGSNDEGKHLPYLMLE